jgi:nucleotide-binding universal stress UspA family protein
MSYKSLLIHVAAGHENTGVYAAGAVLADMFDASIMGISGVRLTPPYSEVPIVDMAQYQQEAAEKTLKQSETAFRAAFGNSKAQLSWRSVYDYVPVNDFIAREARAADLVITSPETGGFLERLDETHVGPLVLQAGRPVLIVPKQQRAFKLGKIVVAWKDTREARRAIADALPLLKKAGEVVVAEICAPAQTEATTEHVADVGRWLKAHGITARAVVESCEDKDPDGLHRVLKRENGDLVVAGAYGHTRLREWIFGGITMDLLLPAERSVLLSH